MKPIRFASLIRVSTEKQAKQGESLCTQQAQIKAAVEAVGGKIVRQYGGQEHATAGWEHAEVDRLLQDAQPTPRLFDAVIVAHPDRWSRDNVRSQQGLDALRDAGIRFFVLTTEHDLFDPNARLFLSMSAVIGGYQASVQNKKSIENKIARAQRGIPAVGKLPYGRTYDRATGKWGLDQGKVKIIKDIAKRYLAGESLHDLAAEYRLTHSVLHLTLMERCGPTWKVQYRAKNLKIDETVQLAVPPLLDDATIEALRRKAATARTKYHRPPKHEYALARFVFCGECGAAMCGQANGEGRTYYRRTHHKPKCRSTISSIPAKPLENAVFGILFDLIGNPRRMERAVKRAIPNQEEINQLREQISRIDQQLAALAKGRERLLDRLSSGTIDEEEADQQLAKSKVRRERLQAERQRYAGSLAAIPAPEAVKRQGREISVAVRAAIRAHGHTADPAEMTFEEKRALAERVFGGDLQLDGKKPGVYVELLDPKASKRCYRFQIWGNLTQKAQGIVRSSYSVQS